MARPKGKKGKKEVSIGDLQTLKLTQLRQRALAMGAPPERVDDALDSTSARDAMILLIREILDSEAEAARLEAEEARLEGKNTVCGKPLSPADRKLWRQAIALLLGLKLKNGFGETGLTAAVGTALRRGATRRNCEDCGVTVARGAAYSGAHVGGVDGG